MSFFPITRASLGPICLTVGVILASVQVTQAADVACPVRLSSGALEQGTISLSFMNSGKTPIRELNLECTRMQGQKAARAACHSESGVFYPGTPYTFRFAYTGKPSRSIEVSVASLRFQDGTLWTSTQDQPCRALTVVSK